MLTYKITSHEPLPTGRKKGRKSLRQNDPQLKEKLFEAILQRNRLKVGDRVRVVNSSRRGTVVEIIYDINKVVWQGGNPQNIIVDFDDGKTEIGCIYQLTRKRA